MSNDDLELHQINVLKSLSGLSASNAVRVLESALYKARLDDMIDIMKYHINQPISANLSDISEDEFSLSSIEAKRQKQQDIIDARLPKSL